MDRIALDNLMLHIAHGDEIAFEELYNQTKSGLYSFILSICKNHHMAEDVMQSTYIECVFLPTCAKQDQTLLRGYTPLQKT